MHTFGRTYLCQVSISWTVCVVNLLSIVCELTGAALLMGR